MNTIMFALGIVIMVASPLLFVLTKMPAAQITDTLIQPWGFKAAQ
jgi:hypothetical protein